MSYFKQGDSLMMVFSQTCSVLHEQRISPSLFCNFEVSWGGANRSLKNYGFIHDAIFFTCMDVHKSLSNVTIIIQDCWIRNTVVCMKTGRAFGIHCWLSVWTERSMILQPILHTWKDSLCCGDLHAHLHEVNHKVHLRNISKHFKSTPQVFWLNIVAEITNKDGMDICRTIHMG